MEIRRLTGDEAHAFGPQFVALMAEIFDADAAARKRDAWDWLFDTPLAAEGHRTEVLAVFDGETAVGGALMLPVMVALDGRLDVWRHPMGVMAAPDRRGTGLTLIRSFFSTYDKVMGFARNDRVERVYRRLSDGKGTGMDNHFRPLRPGRIAARRKELGAVGRALLAPADLAWRSGVGLRRAIKGAARGFETEEITDFGPEFDRLWQDAHGGYSIIHLRNAAQLNWRYRDFPLGRYRIFLLRQGGQPAGYVVTRLQEGGGRRNLLIVDIFCASGAADVYAALLDRAEGAALEARADQIILQATRHCWANGVIGRAGYHFRKPVNDLLVRSADPATHARLGEAIDGYHYCRGDGDEDY
ncbi:hypothetical protein [Roseovarius amoyensis]|uniref:hypothetical protein n=1 Tax=Roseovarius amoyensis TaxID=2211448 RepID=UPI000DBE63E0|nr:hypothetical protein [Roseovarius amoyensis]